MRTTARCPTASFLSPFAADPRPRAAQKHSGTSTTASRCTFRRRSVSTATTCFPCSPATGSSTPRGTRGSTTRPASSRGARRVGRHLSARRAAREPRRKHLGGTGWRSCAGLVGAATNSSTRFLIVPNRPDLVEHGRFFESGSSQLIRRTPTSQDTLHCCRPPRRPTPAPRRRACVGYGRRHRPISRKPR